MALTKEEILALEVTLEGIEKARRQIRQMTNETVKGNEKIKGSTKKTGDAFDRTSKQVNKLNQMLYLGGAASLAVGGVAALDALLTKAESLRNVSAGFQTLTGRINESASAMMTGMREASDGFVRDMELMRQANTAMVLGLPVTAESMAELTDIALTLGRAMGVDATRSLESMITGIGRQSRMMLDNIGIIVSAEEAYSKYANKIGVQVEKLTDAQRKQAFYNEVLEQGRKKVQGLSSDTETLSGNWIKLKTTVGNTIDAMIKDLNEIDTAVEKTGGIMGDFGVFNRLMQDDTMFQEFYRAGDFQTYTGALKAWEEYNQELDKAMSATGDINDNLQQGWLLTKRTREAQEKLNEARQKYFDLTIGQTELPGLHDAVVDPNASTGGLLPEGDLGFGIGTPTPPDPTAFEEEQQANLFEVRMAWAEQWSEAQQEMIQTQINSEYEARLNAANILGADTTAIMTAWEEELTNTNEEFSHRRRAIQDAEAKHKIRTGLMVASATVGFLSAAFGKSKAIKYAEAIINTASAVTEALPNIPLAVAVGISGAAQIATIAKTSPGSASGASAGSVGLSPGGASQLSPTPRGGGGGPVEVRVFLEGAGYIQVSKEELAQEIGEEYARQASRAGTGG